MSNIARCSLCGAEAHVYQAHSNKFLCKKCFVNNIVCRVRNYVAKHNLFSHEENILLSLSGGKDSFVLLDILAKIHSRDKLTGLMIIEGVPGYDRGGEVEVMKKYAREHGVKLYVARFSENLGFSMKDVIDRLKSKKLDISLCTFCGGIRRRLINVIARSLKADKVATAHTLDDEVQTTLINILRGDVDRIVRQAPKALRLSKLFVQRVKPLRRIYEWESALYSYYMGFKFQSKECPFITSRPTIRAKIRLLLEDLESRKPGFMLRVMDLIDDVSSRAKDKVSGSPELPLCSLCGEPTSYGRSICRLCELLGKIGLKLELSESNVVLHRVV